MKEIGLTGVPGSGKSTVFAALTRHGAPSGRAGRAIVSVPDPRLEVLAALERSKGTTAAQLQFVDVPGGTGAHALATLRETDALLLVLRAFGPGARPAEELDEVSTRLLLADLEVVETALDTARRKLRTRGREGTAEVETLERARTELSGGTPLGRSGLDPEERRRLRGLALLTLKPWIPLANLAEGMDLPRELPEGTIPIHAKIEAETAGMPEHEARALLAEFGVTDLALPRVIAACYGALDLITFLTANENEARAWQLPRGSTAQEAAGAIHSDMQRGFIRAEVISFEDLVSAGGFEAARHRGMVRVEGKDYVVRDSDVLRVRFAV